MTNAKGKSFSCREAAERYLETFIDAGKTEEVKDTAGADPASPVPAAATMLAVETTHMPAVAADMRWPEHISAFVVLRGVAPGVYRTWYVLLNFLSTTDTDRSCPFKGGLFQRY